VYYFTQCNTATQQFGIEGKSAANEANLVSSELSNVIKQMPSFRIFIATN
jgi:hypothetical protein